MKINIKCGTQIIGPVFLRHMYEFMDTELYDESYTCLLSELTEVNSLYPPDFTTDYNWVGWWLRSHGG
jgi:hypothetical protein